MKLKSLVFSVLLGFCSASTAANEHVHASAALDTKRAGNCEIEIINRSYTDVQVYGVFDDGSRLNPFDVYSFEAPHYISLYYYGYCHAGMDIYIDTFDGDSIYAGYTRRKQTIRIVPYLTNQIKVEIK